MGNLAIQTEDLGKRYRLGVTATMDRSFREMLTEKAERAVRRLLPSKVPAKAQSEGKNPFLWALRHVSLEINHSEIIGIVGGNGAGKSTLLKILSRITDPTEGRAVLNGRVGSLLEVGTGFHPELTGRENIFLNGAILGMGRREIKNKTDAIIDFAEIERFLDTPVKRYSSGMYVRLAFAVAAHLEPEILIIDEVLAVGDSKFQEKCLGKMQSSASEGRTVLFVSHNMGAVKALCQRAILIDNGQMLADGPVEEVVNQYLSGNEPDRNSGIIPENAMRITNDQARIVEVGMFDIENQQKTKLFFGQPYRIRFVCEVFEEIPDGHFEISISAQDHTHVLYSSTIDRGGKPRRLTPGRHIVTADFDTVLLPRKYAIDLGVHHHNGTTADFVQGTHSFTVLPTAQGREDHYRWHGSVRGYVRAPAVWDLTQTQG